MRSPALAIAWELGRRHRWGLIAVASYVVILAVLRVGATSLEDSVRFAFAVIVPLTSAFLYLLAVFTFGFAGDVGTRQSMFPSRLFTLPVSTTALAGWPMLYGTVAVAALWLATERLALWPSGLDVPVFWPPLFLAVFLAWAQALVWLPYGLPRLRIVAAVLWLMVIDVVAIVALEFRPAEGLMVAILVPQLPLAYFAARLAVARARRGDTPDWTGKLARLAAIASVLPRRRDHFPSPAQAQVWFEWRRHGRTLPVWVGILLPFELALLFVAGSGTPSLVIYTLGGVLITPPVMAAFVAPAARRSGSGTNDPHDLTPFSAARPLTTAALVAARLRVAVWSTLAAWLLVLVAVPLALTLSGTWPVVVERVHRLSHIVGAPRAVVAAALLLWLLVAATWKQLVQRLYVALSGRGWLIKASVFLTVTFLVFIEPIVQWISGNGAALAALWAAFPWILAVLVALKTAAAAWIAVRLHHSRLLTDRVLLTGAVWWLVSVLALYGLLLWLLLSPQVPRYVLLLFAILAIPLARLSAAPLALAWNRHR